MRGYVSLFDNIVFVEGAAEEARMLAPVKVDLSFKIGAHFKNLNDVKLSLAEQCRNSGGNCVCNFKYGQKSRWLAIDDVAYFGDGSACVLSEDDYRLAIEKVQNRK